MTATGDEAQQDRSGPRHPSGPALAVLLGLVPSWFVVDLFGNDPSPFMAAALTAAGLLTVRCRGRWYQVLPALVLLRWAWYPRFELGVAAAAMLLAVAIGFRWPRAAAPASVAVWLTLVYQYGARIGSILAVLAIGPTLVWALLGDTIALSGLPGGRRWDRVARCALVTAPILLVVAAIEVLAPGIRVPSLLVGAVGAFLGLCFLAPGIGEAVAGSAARDALATAGSRLAGSRALPARALAALAPAGRWLLATDTTDTADAVDATDAPPPEDRPRGTRTPPRWRSYLEPLGAWVVSWYVLSKVLLAASIHWNGGSPSRLGLLPSFTDAAGKIGWGSGDYWKIAEHGYRKGEALEAAFPLYALLTRWLSQFVIHDLHRSQVLIATVGGLAGTLLLWRLLEVHHVHRRARRVALALFLLYPYSFMLAGVGYSDPVLIPLILGAFLLAEGDRPVAAGLVGAVATFTRPNAIALIPALTIFQLLRTGALQPGSFRRGAMRPRLDLRRLRARDLGVGLSILGVGSYAAWLQGHAGDPLYFLTTQEHYGHRPTTAPSTWFKVEFINSPFDFMDHGLEAANHVLSAVVLLGAIALLPRLVRRLGWGVGTYAAAVVATAWVGPNGFAPAGRYLLPVLPFYALVGGEWLAGRRRLLVPGLVVSAALSLALAIAFANPRIWLEW